MLLYIGASKDVLLLKNAVQEWGYNHLVCVDAEPAHKDSYCSRTLDQMMGSVRRRLQHLGCTLEERHDASLNLWSFTCGGALTATLDFFYSTLDTEMAANPALASRLAQARGLIVKGYQPPPQVLTPAVLPAVRELFLSENTRCVGLPGARQPLADRLTEREHDCLSEDEEYEYDTAELYCNHYPSDSDSDESD